MLLQPLDQPEEKAGQIHGTSLMTTHAVAKGFPGGHLTVGILVFTSMTLILAGISDDVIDHERLTVVDMQFSNWLHAHGSPFVTDAMLVATSFGSPLMVTCIAAAMALYLLWRRRPYWLAALALSVAGGALLNMLLKYAFHRTRPHFADPILTLSGYGFPSGHTMMASVLYGVVAVYLIAHTPNWRRRALIVFSTIVLILLVGFSRIYLGVHYLSDTLGAMAEGSAWLSLCFTSVYSFWLRSGQIKGSACSH